MFYPVSMCAYLLLQVCFMENELLYGQEFELDDAALSEDFVLPLDKAHVMKEGTDVTITCFSRMCNVAMEVCRGKKSFHRCHNVI